MLVPVSSVRRTDVDPVARCQCLGPHYLESLLVYYSLYTALYGSMLSSRLARRADETLHVASRTVVAVPDTLHP